MAAEAPVFTFVPTQPRRRERASCDSLGRIGIVFPYSVSKLTLMLHWSKVGFVPNSVPVAVAWGMPWLYYFRPGYLN